jgi:cytochrome c oxidase subunit II|tara:strand:- start:2546 stop:3706 length:1161 start_codon:yes stop_codon:yes gene_type:complete
MKGNSKLKSSFHKIILALLLMPFAAIADWGLNMTQGVTPISQEIYDMHMLTLWVVTIIGILVFGVMFWSIFHHRKSKGVKPAKFSHSTTVEIIWTIIPLIIITSLAIPATKLLIKMDDTSEAQVTVKATGSQWKWKYDYLDEDLTIYSVLDENSTEVSQLNSGKDPMQSENYLLDVDEPIVLPINTKIRILTTAADVIHAWWVPDLGWKRDAIPGYINDNWAVIEKPGVYRGQCAEICGKGHGYMPIVVKAVTMEEYTAWVSEKKLAQAAEKNTSEMVLTMEELMTKGESVYKAQCLACHQANGQGIKGVFPALVKSPVAVDSDKRLIHIQQIILGKNLMPAFGEQLSDVDIAAVTTYERNAWGNDTGDIVQAKEVSEARPQAKAN